MPRPAIVGDQASAASAVHVIFTAALHYGRWVVNVWFAVLRSRRSHCIKREQCQACRGQKMRFHRNSEKKTIEVSVAAHRYHRYSKFIVMSLIGAPFSSIKRTQKSLKPGPLITAPRITFLPLLSVSR